MKIDRILMPKVGCHGYIASACALGVVFLSFLLWHDEILLQMTWGERVRLEQTWPAAAQYVVLEYVLVCISLYLPYVVCTAS